MEDSYLQRSTWQLRCPCKDELATKRENSRISISNDILDTMIIKKDIIGDFFFQKTGQIYQDILFVPNKEYDGTFILQSPFRFFIDINSKCNLSCVGCYFGEKGKEQMSYEDFQKIIDSIVDANSIGIQLLGGEPTLHPDLYKMCKYAKEKGLKVEIISNGYAVNDDLLTKLEGLVDLFGISIDGDQKIHNTLRGRPDSYQKAISTYRNLKNYGYLTKIVMTVNKLNYDKIAHVASLCDDKKDLDVKNIVCNSLSDPHNLFLTTDLKLAVRKQLLELDLPIHATAQGFNDRKETAFYGCTGGTFNGSIDVYGNVYSCLYMRGSEYILGNVFSESVLDIWTENNKKIMKNKLMECADCLFVKQCGGKCYVK